MNVATQMYESSEICNAVKAKFVKLENSEEQISDVLTSLKESLEGKYNVTQTKYDLSIRIDKRKNITTIKNEVTELLNSLIVDFDIDYVFKIVSGAKEVFVRTRRK